VDGHWLEALLRRSFLALDGAPSQFSVSICEAAGLPKV
jgi:hypothetical protein